MASFGVGLNLFASANGTWTWNPGMIGQWVYTSQRSSSFLSIARIKPSIIPFAPSCFGKKPTVWPLGWSVGPQFKYREGGGRAGFHDPRDGSYSASIIWSQRQDPGTGRRVVVQPPLPHGGINGRGRDRDIGFWGVELEGSGYGTKVGPGMGKKDSFYSLCTTRSYRDRISWVLSRCASQVDSAFGR